VTFGGRYRIIDFVLSNFANSGVLRMKVLTQYKSESLNTHISRGWRLSSMLGQFVDSVPRSSAPVLSGTGARPTPSTRTSTWSPTKSRTRLRIRADHIYRMDVRQMLDFHIEQKADCTVAAIPCPSRSAAPSDHHRRQSGPDDRLPGEAEEPKPMIGNPRAALVSMATTSSPRGAGARDRARRRRGQRARLRQVHHQPDAQAHKVRSTTSPQQDPRQEPKEAGYWRDVGDLDTYYDCNMDLVSVDPKLRSTTAGGPSTRRQPTAAPAKFVFANEEEDRVGHATTRW